MMLGGILTCWELSAELLHHHLINMFFKRWTTHAHSYEGACTTFSQLCSPKYIFGIWLFKDKWKIYNTLYVIFMSNKMLFQKVELSLTYLIF